MIINSSRGTINAYMIKLLSTILQLFHYQILKNTHNPILAYKTKCSWCLGGRVKGGCFIKSHTRKSSLPINLVSFVSFCVLRQLISGARLSLAGIYYKTVKIFSLFMGHLYSARFEVGIKYIPTIG